MKYPTLEEVETADRLQICRWMRFLEVKVDKQEIIARLCERCTELGGFTPEISKQIGWEKTRK